MSTIGEIIQILRHKANLDQDELSSLCGWPNKGRLSKYESDIKELTVDDAITLASVLGVSPVIFFSSTMGDTEFINFRCTSVPVVGEIEAGSIRVNDHVLTAQGSIGIVDSESTNFYPIYGLKVNDNALIPHFTNGEVVVVDARSYPTKGDLVVVRERYSRYIIELFPDKKHVYFGLKNISKVQKSIDIKASQVIGVVAQRSNKISHSF
ncbi:S24 family peptidase [Enterobacter kobei]|uniref:S24 family peptidase n=1 Tax=Enterobacter kobei TaxID=208224 RepID=UPI003EDB37FA